VSALQFWTQNLKRLKLTFSSQQLFSDLSLKTLKIEAGRGLYISVAHEVASTFGFPFIGELSTTHPQLFFFYFWQIPIIFTF